MLTCQMFIITCNTYVCHHKLICYQTGRFSLVLVPHIIQKIYTKGWDDTQIYIADTTTQQHWVVEGKCEPRIATDLHREWKAFLSLFDRNGNLNIMKSGEMEHEMTLFHTMRPNGNVLLSQGLLGLCCSIETRDRIEIITITAVLFE